MSDLTLKLSPKGERRRAAILADALRATDMLRRRRRAQRVAATAGAITAIVTLALTAMLAMRHPDPGPLPPIGIHSPTPMTTSPPPRPAPSHAIPRDESVPPIRIMATNRTALIEIVDADPRVAARYVAPIHPSRIQRIDDATLLRTLDASGRNAGLASVGATTLLFVDGQAVR